MNEEISPALQKVVDDENALLEKARDNATLLHLQGRVVTLAKERNDLLATIDELNTDLDELSTELDEYRQAAQEREGS